MRRCTKELIPSLSPFAKAATVSAGTCVATSSSSSGLAPHSYNSSSALTWSSRRHMGFMGSGKKSTVKATPKATAEGSAATTSQGFSGIGNVTTASNVSSNSPASRLRRLAKDVTKTAQCAASVAAETTNTSPGKLPLGEKLDLRNPMSTVTTMDDGTKLHKEKCVMGWKPEEIFAVVADVDKYSEFLPWCVMSQVHSYTPPNTTDLMKVTSMDATLQVGFSFFKEKYTSDVTLVPGHSIHAKLQGDSTLLKELHCDWYFQPYQNFKSNNGSSPLTHAQHPHQIHATEVKFIVSFAFRNPLHTNLTSMVMSNVVSVMTKSFEERIEKMHGAASVKKFYLPHETTSSSASSSSSSAATMAAEEVASSRKFS